MSSVICQNNHDSYDLPLPRTAVGFKWIEGGEGQRCLDKRILIFDRLYGVRVTEHPGGSVELAVRNYCFDLGVCRS